MGNKVIFFATIGGIKSFVSLYKKELDGSATILLSQKKANAQVFECGHELGAMFAHVTHNPKKWYVKATFNGSQIKDIGYLGIQNGSDHYTSWSVKEGVGVRSFDTRADAASFLASFITKATHKYTDFNIVEE